MIKNSAMISPEKAFEIIQSIQKPESFIDKALEDCLGYILAEDLVADRDFPPFNRVMMDGICVKNYQQKEWPIESIVFAGENQIRLTEESSAIEIMTGPHCPKIVQRLSKLKI